MHHHHHQVPGAQPARSEAHEHRADQLAKRGGIDGVQLLLLTVAQVVVVQGAPGQAYTLRRLVVVQQPLELKLDTHNQSAFSEPAEPSVGRLPS